MHLKHSESTSSYETPQIEYKEQVTAATPNPVNDKQEVEDEELFTLTKHSVETEKC